MGRSKTSFPAMKKRFEILEHPADVGFLAYGETLAELFESAAMAMCSLACAPEKIEDPIMVLSVND